MCPRSYLAAGGSQDGASAVFGGGSDSPDCTSSFVATVTPQPADSSSPLALSRARCGLAAASAGDAVIFAGGNTHLGYVDIVDVLDYSARGAVGGNGTWSVRGFSAGGAPKLSVARSWLVGASAPPHFACFLGGFVTKTESKSGAVECYDARAPQAGLATLPSLPSGRMFHAAAGSSNSSGAAAALWVGGGTDGDGVTADVHVLRLPDDADDGAWQPPRGPWAQLPTSLSSKRTKLAAAYAPRAGRVLFAGGEGSDGGEGSWACTGSFCMSDAVDVFDAASGARTATLKLSEPRSRLAAAAATDGCHVALGGGKTLTGYSAVVDVFDLCASPPTHGAGAPLSEARADLSAASLTAASATARASQLVLFVGGSGMAGASTAVDQIPISTALWS